MGKKKINFKTEYETLEKTVNDLEVLEDIDQAIKKYQEGVKHVKACQDYLQSMQTEIKILK